MKENKGFLALVTILVMLSVSLLGFNYYKFYNTEDISTEVFAPTTTVKNAGGLSYQMSENSLIVSNFANAETVGDYNTVELFVDFSSFHSKRLILGNIDEMVSLLEADAPLALDFVVLNYDGARSTTGWSENSAAVMALIANTYPESFIDAMTLLFQFQPEAINGAPVSLGETVALVEDKLGLSFNNEEIAKLSEGYFLRWTDLVVNKFASARGVSALPAVVVNGDVLVDPARELPKVLEGFVITE